MKKIVKIQNLLLLVNRDLSGIANAAQSGNVSFSITKISKAIKHLEELKQLLNE